MEAEKIVIQRVLKREGGFTVDHAGATNYGITKPPYCEYLGRNVTDADIKALTPECAAKFYSWLFTKYKVNWIMNVNLMDLLFDCMVNHGNERAIKWLQRLAGVKADGVIGQQSATAFNRQPKKLYYELLAYRTVFYGKLASSDPNKYLKFLVGWLNRSTEFCKEI